MAESDGSKWTNRELDSTIFLVGALAILVGHIVICAVDKGYRESDMAVQIILVLSPIFGAMSNYFFQKKQGANGNGNGSHK